MPFKTPTLKHTLRTCPSQHPPSSFSQISSPRLRVCNVVNSTQMLNMSQLTSHCHQEICKVEFYGRYVLHVNMEGFQAVLHTSKPTKGNQWIYMLGKRRKTHIFRIIYIIIFIKDSELRDFRVNGSFQYHKM